ncbi:MAG TPA: hypothetical protein VER96_35505 [Polyangiaceae bacterium]|nr:hypothetical protein [Polyangiaceae bacterium]
MIGGQALDVLGIATGDKGALELKGRCNNEGVDCVSGRHAGSGKERARALSDRPGQFDDPRDIAIQEQVDGSVQAPAARYFGEDR